MIFSVFSTVGIIPLGICSDVVSEDTDWITSISQGLILPLIDVYKRQVYVCAMYLFEFYRDKKHSHYSWSNKSDCWRMCDCRKNKKFCIKQSANIKS